MENDRELNDQDTEKFLRRAEDRLRDMERRSDRGIQPFSRGLHPSLTPRYGQSVQPCTKVDTDRMLRLEAPKSLEPYISAVGGIARAKSSQLLDNRLRHLSGQIRRVEDPRILKEKSAEVRYHMR